MRREKEESKEKLETIQNTAPDEKFQNAQQVQNTADAKVDAGDSTGFVLKKNSTKGHSLKTEVAAKTVQDSSYGGVNAGDGLNAGGRGVSGAGGGVLGAANGTPIGGKSRSETRYGKKLDRNSTKLNFIPNDQVLEEYDESKPLAESSDTDQGFNGTYRNEYARSQKKAGNVPAELMFSRSLDIIEKDQVYFPQGQYVKQDGGLVLNDEPTMTVEYVDGIATNPSSSNYSVRRGSYLNRKMRILADDNGLVRAMTFDSRDITPVVDADAANKSSSAALRDRNMAELDREKMDSKAGDEKADIWCPIPRAVRQPTQTVSYLRDIEAMTGAEIATAYKKATTSMSYQLNRAHKDGQDLFAPMVDAFRGFYSGFASRSDSLNGATGLAAIFDDTDYYRGSAALMIAAYDTVAKYNTKADVMVQPRSLRMHLQTADNNMDPFRVPRNFVQIYDNQEVFSTIDRDFDPMLPICMTDKAALATSMSYADLYSFLRPVKIPYHSNALTNAPATNVVLVPKEFSKACTASYLHLFYAKAGTQTEPTINSSTGVITINNNIEKDIFVYVDNQATTGLSDDDYEGLDVALSSYTDLDIAFDPTTKYYNVLVTDLAKTFPDQKGPFRYMYADLRNNYVTTVTFPLLEGLSDYFDDVGRCVIKKLIRNDATHPAYLSGICNAGFSVTLAHSTKYFSLWSFLLCAATPYIVKSRINSMRDVLYYETNVEYPFSDLIPLKDMTTRGYTNFDYVDYDHELASKVMDPATSLKWLFPEFWTKIGADSSNGYTYALAPWYYSENNIKKVGDNITENGDMSSMSFPSIRSGTKLASLDMFYSMTEKDVRLSLDMIASLSTLISDSDIIVPTATLNGAYKYGQMTDGIPYFAFKTSGPTIMDIIKLPRELGYVFDAPYGLLTSNVGDTSLTDPASVSVVHGTSHRVQYWLGANAVKFVAANATQVILSAEEVNVNRAANFKQDWYIMYANGKQAPFDHGMITSINSLFSDAGVAVAGASVFSPYTKFSDGSAAANEKLATAQSFMKAMWTRIQKIPFVISPFDALSSSSTRTSYIDIFELAYYFGLCGFRASDYRESVYNREKQVVNQGLTFVTDPWIVASPLFKEGAKSSGISLKVGY